MKLSETEWRFFILFANENGELVHSIGYETLPNVASIRENFGELSGPEFGIEDDINDLLVDIITTEEYIEYFGDIDIEEV